jgi:CRISPR-associated protein Csb2
MLTIEVELLTGRYAATEYNDRSSAEWPPHPARFFSALVSALHENEPADAREREALLWLEQQTAPSLDVDLDCQRRRVLDTYVPVNDVTIVGDPEKPLRDATTKLSALPQQASPAEAKKAKALVARETAKLAAFLKVQQVQDVKPSQSDLDKAIALLPERRTRQVRTFPVALPERPWFSFNWAVEAPVTHRSALHSLCNRVTRLGHSSSFVRCAIVEREPDITLTPALRGEHVLRTVGPGQLEQLEQAHRLHLGIEQRTLPSRPQRYGPPEPSIRDDIARSVFSDNWIIFQREGGARLLSSRTADLCKALRAAIIEQAGSHSLPPSLSGHLASGERTNAPHIAFIAPPFVGYPHADGAIQGCAIVLPRDLTATERDALYRTIANWEKTRAEEGLLTLAGQGLPAVHFKRIEIPKVSLQERRWSKPSRRFVTATPIALDKNPGNLRSNQGGTAQKAAVEAQQSIATACANIGLPRPISVEISLAPLLAGAQPVGAFAPWPRIPGRPPRVRVHADIIFAEPVRGPVLLGAGRYMGLGLCLPVETTEVE